MLFLVTEQVRLLVLGPLPASIPRLRARLGRRARSPPLPGPPTPGPVTSGCRLNQAPQTATQGPHAALRKVSLKHRAKVKEDVRWTSTKLTPLGWQWLTASHRFRGYSCGTSPAHGLVCLPSKVKFPSAAIDLTPLAPYYCPRPAR